mgnify:CR=1 FL=1
MNIDLDTTEGRKEYLSEKLDDLLDGINQSYGTVLMDELLNRLELTVKDFNEEMETVFDELKINEKNRQSMLLKLSKKKTPEEINEEETRKKEWEQKLLDLYGKGQESIDADEASEVNKKEEKK